MEGRLPLSDSEGIFLLRSSERGGASGFFSLSVEAFSFLSSGQGRNHKMGPKTELRESLRDRPVC